MDSKKDPNVEQPDATEPRMPHRSLSVNDVGECIEVRDMDTQTDPITGSLNDEYLDYGDMATQTNVSMANNGGRLGDTVLVDVGTQTETSFQAELYKIKGLIDKALLILAQGEIRWNEIEAAEGKLRDILELLGVGAGGGAGGAGGGGSGGGSGGGGEEA